MNEHLKNEAQIKRTEQTETAYGIWEQILAFAEKIKELEQEEAVLHLGQDFKTLGDLARRSLRKLEAVFGVQGEESRSGKELAHSEHADKEPSEQDRGLDPVKKGASLENAAIPASKEGRGEETLDDADADQKADDAGKLAPAADADEKEEKFEGNQLSSEPVDGDKQI